MNIEKYTDRARGFVQSAHLWPFARATSNSHPNIS